MDKAARIVIDERIYPGKPIIRGTRILVETILGSLKAGMTWEEAMKEYNIEREDIEAALQHGRYQAA